MVSPQQNPDPRGVTPPHPVLDLSTSINLEKIFEQRVEECREAVGSGNCQQALRLTDSTIADAKLIPEGNVQLFLWVCSQCTDIALLAGDPRAAGRYAVLGIGATRGQAHLPENVLAYATLVNSLALVYDQSGETDLALVTIQDAGRRLKEANIDAPQLSVTIAYNHGLFLSHGGSYVAAANLLRDVVKMLDPTTELGAANLDLRCHALALYADMLFKNRAYPEIPRVWEYHIGSCDPWSGAPLMWFATHVTLGAALSFDFRVSRDAANRGLELVSEDPQSEYCGALLHLGRSVSFAAGRLLSTARQELDLFIAGTRMVEEGMADGMRQLGRGLLAHSLKLRLPKNDIESLVARISDY